MAASTVPALATSCPRSAALLAAAMALLWAGCRSSPAAAPVPVVPQAPPDGPTLDDFAGRWTWQHVSDVGGVRRVEVEDWQLARDSDRLRGTCRSRVTFLSTDGQPFACANSLHYELDAEYRIEARYSGTALAVDEVDVQVAPSPCDSGERPLSSYRARLVPERQLELTWASGQQLLTASEEPRLPPLGSPASPAGRWRWTNRTQRGDEVRVELEEWSLTIEEDSHFSGTYQRTVHLFSASGSPLPCADRSHYSYRDQYRVSGWQRGPELLIAETAVTADAHPCPNRQRRQLDSARGRVVGEHLVLTWRGRHRQVLRREADARDVSADEARPGAARLAPDQSPRPDPRQPGAPTAP